MTTPISSNSPTSEFMTKYNYDTIQHTYMMKTNESHKCLASEFKQLSETKKHLMELIPDDIPVKLYFDADYKHTDNFDDYDIECANHILRLNQLYLTQFCIDTMGITPKFATAEAHYKSKVVDGVEKWAYSFHIVIPNIVAFKKDILEMGRTLNEFIQKDQLQYSQITHGDKYKEYVTGGIKEAFDLSVYKTGMQKFRCVNSSKDGENRPFNLIQGTHEDMIITGHIQPDAVFHHPPVSEQLPTIVKTCIPSIDSSDKKYEILCANMCLDKGLFFADSKETTKWLEMGLFMKGYFGDSLESYALFDKFSQLGGGSYTPSDNKDRWDGFATNEKYDNFGIFVNKAKKYDKVKYKEIDDEIKILKKNDKKNSKTTRSDDKESETDAFNRLVVPFELLHTKVINEGIYVKKLEDSCLMLTEKQLVASYKHMQCGYSNSGAPVCFINKWISFNDNINQKDFMEVYPNDALCPSNTLNLWVPFAMEKYTDSYTTHQEGLDMMLNHIKILCDHQESVYKYFIQWISMMIQRPEKKSSCIVLLSSEGAGKGTLMHLFSKMMGTKKVMESKDPARDVWGDFNSLMNDAFLVNLNELEYKDTSVAEGKIKGLISDPKMYINKKGCPQFPITSYHHFIITSNKENPIKTEAGDRRKIIIRSSDEKCKDKVYFDKSYELLENIDVVRSCYDYFKNYDISKFNHEDIPHTEYQDDLKELSRSPVDRWLEYFTYKNQYEVNITMTGIEVYNKFMEWCGENIIEFDTNPLKLGMKLTNLKIKGIEKGNATMNGKTKKFNIPLLKAHYKIGCVISM